MLITTILQHNIKFIREYLDMKQRQLAEDIGVKVDMVEKFENRGDNPKMPVLENLSKVFGIAIEILKSVRMTGDLYEQHFDKSIVRIPQEPVPLLEEPVVEYDLKKVETPDEVIASQQGSIERLTKHVEILQNKIIELESRSGNVQS